jgi:hypothetical protein
VGECLSNHRRLTENPFADSVGSYKVSITSVGVHPVGECLSNHRRLTENPFADSVGSYNVFDNHP